MSELLTPEFQAGRVWTTRGRDSGLTYARRTMRTSKGWARNEVVRNFTVAKTGGRDKPLNILTMPGMDWSFERSLIDMRERGRGKARPRVTFITAIESSAPIFTMGLRRAPGGDHISTAVACPAYAKAAARTYGISRYYLARFEDMAHLDEWVYDAAWIDLTGPITVPRLAALSALWQRTTSRLIVTSLNARWPANMVSRLQETGGLSEALMESCEGAVAVDELLYSDRSPMSQITLARLYTPERTP